MFLFMAWLRLPARPCPLAAFASRMVAVYGVRRLRFEFDLDKQRKLDCRETATRTSGTVSWRFAWKPRGSSECARVPVPLRRANPHRGLAHAPRSIVRRQ